MKNPLNYQESLAQVEAIINEIESGDLNLTDLFQKIKVALDYLKQCESILMSSEQEMELLIETLRDESGEDSQEECPF